MFIFFFSCRICNFMRLRLLFRLFICFLMVALWFWFVFSLVRVSDSWSWRLFSVVWIVENVVLVNVGDLDLVMGDLDLFLSIGERVRVDGEMDRVLDGEIDFRFFSLLNSLALLMIVFAMLRRVLWRVSVSFRICLVVFVLGRS